MVDTYPWRCTWCTKLLTAASPSSESSSKKAGPTHGPNRLGDVIRLAGQKAAELSGRRLLIFVTDLQERDWRNAEGAIYEDLRRSLRSLRRGDEEAPPLVVLDVGDRRLPLDFLGDSARFTRLRAAVALSPSRASRLMTSSRSTFLISSRSTSRPLIRRRSRRMTFSTASSCVSSAAKT